MRKTRRVIWLLVLLQLGWSCLVPAQNTPLAPNYTIAPMQAYEGVLDLRKRDLSDKWVPLNGQWIFYWKQLLMPRDSAPKPTGLVYFPQLWGNIRGVGNFPSQGYATYALTVILP